MSAQPSYGRAGRGGGSGRTESRLLQLMRDAGFREELPPSTVSWFNTHPVFQWLSANLSTDNFNSAATQQLYEEHVVNTSGAASLISAMGLSSSSESSDGAEEHARWVDAAGVEELQAAVRDKEQYVALLQAQAATLHAASSQLDSSLHQQRARHKGAAGAAAAAGTALRRAQAAVADADAAIAAELRQLAAVVSELTALVREQPGRWLLCAAELGPYSQQDALARAQFDRAMGQLSDSASGRQSRMQQSPARAAAREAADVARHKDQGTRSEALRRELGRQRMAFKVALDERLRTSARLAQLQGQLGAAEQLKMGSGVHRDSAVLSGQVHQLEAEFAILEETRSALAGDVLPTLTEAVARLNDTHILQGDYDRQLRKMEADQQRKVHLIQQLLASSSRHMVLGLIQDTELERLAGLMDMLHDCQQLLDDFLAASRHRSAAYSAAASAATPPRSVVQADDSYLLRLHQALAPHLATASTDLTSLLRDGGADADDAHSRLNAAATAAASAASGTPLAGNASAVSTGRAVPSAATPPRTPGYVGVREVAEGVRAVGATLSSGAAGLDERLCRQLPARRATALSTVEDLHSLAYAHPSDAAPTLTHPSVAEAMAALDGLNRELSAAITRLCKQQGDYVSVLTQHKREQELERRVMQLHFTKPQALVEAVAELHGRVEGLAGGAAAALAAGQTAGGLL